MHPCFMHGWEETNPCFILGWAENTTLFYLWLGRKCILVFMYGWEETNPCFNYGWVENKSLIYLWIGRFYVWMGGNQSLLYQWFGKKQIQLFVYMLMHKNTLVSSMDGQKTNPCFIYGWVENKSNCLSIC